MQSVSRVWAAEEGKRGEKRKRKEEKEIGYSLYLYFFAL
jgi:hypothetical protein